MSWHLYEGFSLTVEVDEEAARYLDEVVDLLTETEAGSAKRLALLADLKAVVDKHSALTPIPRLTKP